MIRSVFQLTIITFVFTTTNSESGIWQMKSNSITSARIVSSNEASALARASRAKRSLFLSATADLIVDKHNELRRLRQSSDMEMLVWNNYLELMAEEWARGCAWEHGQPGRSADTLPFEKIGQNLLTSNGTFDPVMAVQLWYDEVEFYDFDTGGCSLPPCGHYTQVVWSTSREVGCAWAYCPTMSKSDIINANYLVCNYGPTGNYVGLKPYEIGPACTTCKIGKFWCENELCRRDCSRQKTRCTCEANCKHCGRTIQDDCTCECAPGWHGDDCSKRCLNTHNFCGANPGWPVAWCNVSYVIDFCPVLCGLCAQWNPGRDSACHDQGTTTTIITTPETPPTTTSSISDEKKTRNRRTTASTTSTTNTSTTTTPDRHENQLPDASLGEAQYSNKVNDAATQYHYQIWPILSAFIGIMNIFYCKEIINYCAL